MKTVDRIKVYDILNNIIATEPVEWEQLKAAVETAVNVVNWMDVRDVVRFMQHQGMIDRTDEVLHERYFKI